jgi:hypothetical protein
MKTARTKGKTGKGNTTRNYIIKRKMVSKAE